LAVSIAVATVHLAVGLSCHETLAGFLVLEGLWMFCFGLMAGNFGTLAMEPMGHIAGSAASAQGFITMVVGAFVGSAIGRAFDGTVVPLVVGSAAWPRWPWWRWPSAVGFSNRAGMPRRTRLSCCFKEVDHE
jgi:hypothetical protein